MVMLSAHIQSFLKLISTQLEETSRGVTSSHHFHNVQCGIENILSLLEYNNDLVDKADQLSRRAYKARTAATRSQPSVWKKTQASIDNRHQTSDRLSSGGCVYR